jgi:isocitrate lyase
MDTVPNKVDHLFRAQVFHDRKQRHERSSMSREDRNSTPPVDYFRPIIADADTGHGGLTAIMKLTKLFIGTHHFSRNQIICISFSFSYFLFFLPIFLV